MDVHLAFGIAALIGSISANVIYLAQIIRYKDQQIPSKLSWTIWAVLEFFLCVVVLKTATDPGIMLLPISAALGAIAIYFVLPIDRKNKLDKFDKQVIAGTVLGLLIWLFSGEGIPAILIGVCINFLGGIPTIQGLRNGKRRENCQAWTVGAFACLFNMLAIEQWKPENYLHPVGFGITAWIVWTYVLRYPNRHLINP